MKIKNIYIQKNDWANKSSSYVSLCESKKNINRFDSRCFVPFEIVLKITSAHFCIYIYIYIWNKPEEILSFSLFSWELPLRARTSIICGQVSMRVNICERKLVTLSSLVIVACIACLRFCLSLSLPLSTSSSLLSRLFFFDRPQLSNRLTIANKFFLFFVYFRHKWVNTHYHPHFLFYFFSVCYQCGLHDALLC